MASLGYNDSTQSLLTHRAYQALKQTSVCMGSLTLIYIKPLLFGSWGTASSLCLSGSDALHQVFACQMFILPSLLCSLLLGTTKKKRLITENLHGLLRPAIWGILFCSKWYPGLFNSLLAQSWPLKNRILISLTCGPKMQALTPDNYSVS